MWCISSYACVLCGLNGQGGAISVCMVCFRLVANLVYEKIDAGNVGTQGGMDEHVVLEIIIEITVCFVFDGITVCFGFCCLKVGSLSTLCGET